MNFKNIKIPNNWQIKIKIKNKLNSIKGKPTELYRNRLEELRKPEPSGCEMISLSGI